MGIRMMAFLTLTLLAPGCSCTNCSCKCLFHETKKSGYACDLINKLQTSEDVNKKAIEGLVRRTTQLTISAEKEIQKAALKISALEGMVDELRNKSRDLLNRILVLEASTSDRFRATADKRTRLREEMEEAKREAGRQRDALAHRQTNFQEEFSTKWRHQENKIRDLEQEIATNSEEDRERTSEVRKELLKRVEEGERQTMESKTEILDRLRQSERKIRETDRFLQDTTDVVAELSRKVEKTKSEKLQAKMEKMQSTVSSLVTSQSELKEEIRANLSFHLKTDIQDRLLQLRHLTTKIKQVEDRQVSLEQELSQCLGNLSDLDGAVREHARASSVEHQSLRSEMFGHVTELRAQCAARNDVNRTIAFLSADLHETQRHLQDLKKEVLMANCEDSLPVSTCKNSVERHMCRFEYTATRCCASCARATHLLPPKKKKETKYS